MPTDDEAWAAINRLEQRVAELEAETLDKKALVTILQKDHDIQRAIYEAFNKVAKIKSRQGVVER